MEEDSFEFHEEGDENISYNSSESQENIYHDEEGLFANSWLSIVPSQQHQILPLPQQAQKVNMPQTPLEPFQLNEDNGVCKVCYKYAINGLICSNEKCSILMCEKCVVQTTKKNSDKKCPFCRVEPFRPIASPYRNAINKLQWKCTLCHQMYILEEEQKHYKNVCSYFHKIDCFYCSQKLNKDQVVKHTRVCHQDKLDQMIKDLYECPPPLYDAKQVVSQKGDYLNKIGKSPHLGTTGKFYCGERLDPPKCTCCNGFCGPTNGQNCYECMKLDVLRLGLKKGYLLNSSGQVCWKQGHTFVCNTMNYYENTFCKEGNPCRSCYNMTKNIQRYADLL